MNWAHVDDRGELDLELVVEELHKKRTKAVFAQRMLQYRREMGRGDNQRMLKTSRKYAHVHTDCTEYPQSLEE